MHMPGILVVTLEVLHQSQILMLPLGGVHVKHAVQRGISVQTQYLFWDQRKLQKTFI
jgi:hypothetical protein